jgi:uncharacterized membrane protein
MPEPSVERASFQWEMFIGQKALGWAAVVLLLFSVAFFLRYAFQNDWIGPLGRVAVGAFAGAALTVVGLNHHRRGWLVFSRMLSAAGVVVLYLATYSAFGFYHLLPQSHAGVFLLVIVAETMIIAALYESLAIGLMAVLGGLLTPLLMYSDTDQYVPLFTYLVVLNAGVAFTTILRTWPIVASASLLGSQALFWMWYGENYHPEKFEWALGFQLAVYLVFLFHGLGVQRFRPSWQIWEVCGRIVLNAFFWFTAFYVLTEADYGEWIGSAAVVMAIVYAIAARVGLIRQRADNPEVLTYLAVAVGFIALTFPIQADARWVAFGWAAMAGVLGWFGQRINSLPLRVLAAGLGCTAVLRLLLFDAPQPVSWPFAPVLNEFALPSVGVALCILGAVIAARRFLSQRGAFERGLTAAAGIGGIVLLWLVLSIDCHRYFAARAIQPEADANHWRWLGQLTLSAMWTVFATIVLAIGFRVRVASLRWLAITLYAITVAKVIFLDMAYLEQFYRVLAFFILAVFLGLAARAYQRLRPTTRSTPGVGAENEPL